MSYWHWFFKGSGGKRGYRRLLNAWILFHLAIGTFLALVVAVDLATAAGSVLLPLVGILIGLAFAWAGNAQALLQTSEIEDLSEHHAGGFIEYAFTYQTAILAILATLVLWALAGLRVYDDLLPTPFHHKTYFAFKIVLFGFASLTLRECWHVILGAQWMLLSRRAIKKIKAQDVNHQCHLDEPPATPTKKQGTTRLQGK